jgi:hypothetical protein
VEHLADRGDARVLALDPVVQAEQLVEVRGARLQVPVLVDGAEGEGREIRILVDVGQDRERE